MLSLLNLHIQCVRRNPPQSDQTGDGFLLTFADASFFDDVALIFLQNS